MRLIANELSRQTEPILMSRIPQSHRLENDFVCQPHTPSLLIVKAIGYFWLSDGRRHDQGPSYYQNPCLTLDTSAPKLKVAHPLILLSILDQFRSSQGNERLEPCYFSNFTWIGDGSRALTELYRICPRALICSIHQRKIWRLLSNRLC